MRPLLFALTITTFCASIALPDLRYQAFLDHCKACSSERDEQSTNPQLTAMQVRWEHERRACGGVR